MLPLSHISAWCTEGRHYFYGLKFVLQKIWNIIIRIILSSNGVSCNMILFHIHGSFHKLCTRWQNCGVDDAIPVIVMSVTVEDLRRQHVCSLLP
jgi:hypothetical protein